MELTAENVRQMINQQTAANNAWSAEQAQKQMDFQKEMSNTAHQREVADLKAAGLNPVLAANQGASSAVGASADPDQSGNSALVSFLGNLIQTQNQLELQKNNADLQRELTDKTNALTAMIAELNRAVGLETAQMSASAQIAAANAAAGANMYSADQANYREELSQRFQNARQILSNAQERSMLSQKLQHEEYMAKYYPTTTAQAAAAAVAQGLDTVKSVSNSLSNRQKKSITDIVSKVLGRNFLPSSLYDSLTRKKAISGGGRR